MEAGETCGTLEVREPEDVLDALTDPGGPFLIGVRHHAPSLAAAVPHLLDAARPDVLLVELPAELQDWLRWLAHEHTVAPVALAAVTRAGADGMAGHAPAFYPFADFSPELAALRWAARNGVPAVACDLPLADPAWRGHRRNPADTGPALRPALPATLHDALRTRLTGRDGEDLWDRLVEAPAPGSTPEAVRRAALLTGWALRSDAERGPGVDPLDLAREHRMRAHLRAALDEGRRPAAVIGAFHAPALALPSAASGGTGQCRAPDPAPSPAPATCTVSLIPYTYALLDERSGYPAGIRDPEWQQLVLEAGGDTARLEDAVVRTAVRICAELRGQDHASGPADAREIARHATDLARLRGLPAPGRGELVEAVQSVLAQGEPLGRGRAVARALEGVLVGRRTGRPAPGAPRSGLAPAVEAELAALGLPGPGSPAADRELRLDPLRSGPDRDREILLRRLAVCGIPYAEEQATSGPAGTDTLTSRWRVRWTPATAALLAAAGHRGVTSAQATEGTLRERHRTAVAEGGPTAAQTVEGLALAAACGLPALAAERLAETAAVVPGAGTLPELLAALALVDRLGAGHVPGLSGGDPAPDWRDRLADTAEALTTAAVRQVDGLTGSEDPADARALLELAHRADRTGGIRLGDALARLAAEGSPLMRGAAGAVRVLLGHEDPSALGTRAASWLDAAAGPAARADLTARLTGLLTASAPLLETAPATLTPLLDRVTSLPDRDFLDRLPALRGGFDTLSPAARDRLLAVVEERTGTQVTDLADLDPGTLAAWTRADLAARGTLAAEDLLPVPAPHAGPSRRGAPYAVPAHRTAPAPTAGAGDPRPGVGAAPVGTRPPAGGSPQDGPALPHASPVPGAARPADAADAASGPQDADGTSAPGTLRPGTEPPRTAPPGRTAPALAGPDEETASPVGGTPGEPALPPASAAGGTRPADGIPCPAGAGAHTAHDLAAVRPEPGGPAGLTADQDRLTPAERWRLVLGRRAERLGGRAAALATALDELYGQGRGEGAGGDLTGPAGRRGGREAPYPGVREWAAELAALFGPGIREEVLAAAAAAGRQDAAFALDPDSVRPSVDLLRTVLQHAGGLPEARLAALRPLVRRLVDELTRQLATRMRPALTGAVQQRPTSRPGGGLDLARTLRANLATARRAPEGTVQVVPERPVFRSRGRRSADWRLVIVTDVSGSMEASTIWSALTASVLAGVPALSTHFLAFSTEVLDFTDHIHDPLGLLLEVRVGGGTHIAAALRHARTLVTAPSRTLVVVVSDFEEGYPMGGLLSEVRELIGSGCHLLGCAGLDDAGRPRYSKGVAGQLVAAGMPVAALSPLELARWVGEKIR
ncbi:VWA domain-containing protein [Streptomyces sp. GC420]|nr:VWA domain-containing protein [Streptomyces sp. GC420]